MSISSEPELDRADWSRFSGKGGRCIVCGHVAAVTITLTATAVAEQRGGGMLTKQSVPFCHTHGIARYADALNKLK